MLAVLLCLTPFGSPHSLIFGASFGTVSSSDRARAFERVYAEGRWKGGMDGARCGSGWSDIESGQGVAALRAVLDVVSAYGIRSIADIPCGDGCFAGSLLAALGPNKTTSYEGVDIVRSLVERNRQVYGGAGVQFTHADVVSGSASLPRADLVFSRQMLQHLCDDDALRFIRHVARSPARYVLMTTFVTDGDFANADIPCDSGGYRPQDLTKPPFSLPPPMALFSEQYPTDPRTALGLWPVRALRRRLLR